VINNLFAAQHNALLIIERLRGLNANYSRLACGEDLMYETQIFDTIIVIEESIGSQKGELRK
jgi:hypothetical protein